MIEYLSSYDNDPIYTFNGLSLIICFDKNVMKFDYLIIKVVLAP
jgi:hypothetical protein